MKKTIPITCKGSGYLPIEQLKNFQGNLKELSESDFEKIKISLLKYGFTFPVFVWKNNLLDGHQRMYVVKVLIEEGYEIGPIPIVEIMAKNKKEAAEKLLVLNSRYAKMTDEGFMEYVANFEIDLSEMPELELPELDLEELLNPDKKEDGKGEGEGEGNGSDDTESLSLKFTSEQLALVKGKLLEFSEVPEIALLMALGI